MIANMVIDAASLIARGRAPAVKGMNKTEAAYARRLEVLKSAGDVLWFAFEGVTLKLAHDTRYTPDFMVLHADLSLEFVEIKGFERDDARDKFKIAATAFPWARFRMVRLKRGEWEVMRELNVE